MSRPLIAKSLRPALDGAALERARAALAGAGEPRNGSIPGIAADIPFTPAANDQRELSERLRGLAGRPVDVVVQPAPAGARSFSSPTWIPP